MKIHALLPFTLSLLVAACSGSTPPPQDPVVESFDRLQMKMYADTNKVITDRPITITTEVTPLVSGKGGIGMFLANTSSWEFLLPMYRRLEIPQSAAFNDTMNTYYPVDLTANKPLSLLWKVQLHISHYSRFDASVFLDSVFVADSNRYFSVWSHEARVRTPGGFGYDDVAAFEDLSINP